MAWVHGLGGHTPEQRRERLFGGVDELLTAVGMPASLAEMGIARGDFEAALPELADAAFADPSLRTNPRMPLLSELVELLEAGWRGRS
jgi:acetaldehyde dehydrogenase/alcohol dehydrogenase